LETSTRSLAIWCSTSIWLRMHRAVISHGDVSVGRDEDLVEAAGSERRLDNVGDWGLVG
jgi:hypothetical protein